MIDLQSLTYSYPVSEDPALHGLDWHVGAGEHVVVTGVSGCGKSTLARCLTGLIPHFHGGRFGGQVTVAGVDTRLARPGELSRLVGFVAQDPETQTVMDRVEDEVAFGPENHRLARPEMRRRVEAAMDQCGITHLRERELVSLSGGERQRVVIAAALAMGAPVLVLDEPTSQLDPWGAVEVLDAVHGLHGAHGTTVVLIEHRLGRALREATRLVVMGAGGRIVADGAPDVAIQALPDWSSPLAPDVDLYDGSVICGTERYRATIPEGERAIELEDVSFAYRETVAIENVSLAIERGRVTALMGRNGSGKTTLLKLMNGLLRPTGGAVHVLGQDIAGSPVRAIARRVGYAPQNPSAMLFNETVTAELRFTLRALGTSGDPDGLLRQFGLAEHAVNSPLDLSTGERQRVALAAVLIAPRPIVLLDEPTRGMDAGRKRDLAAYLRRLAAGGAAAVVATHDAGFMADAADRVILLDRGQAVADGPVGTVLLGVPAPLGY
ncbi:MAG TPA: ATP-binding cassette domain-containing protein [Thermomicrobiaceae bacterium]|nr:ATP-binding cassette domain-containing protein [Thermomicrobiaceae bacterium]